MNHKSHPKKRKFLGYCEVLEMRGRDKDILSDLKRFRVLRRDDLISMHFSHLTNKVAACNRVMKRLRRDGHVKAVTNNNQYVYMLSEQTMKPDSTKIPHFLHIVDFYHEIKKIQPPRIFDVEPKLGGKGTVEPDIFMIWKDAPFYVEIQRTVYSQRAFEKKLDRYDRYYNEGTWKQAPWQPEENEFFPHLWVVSDRKYKLNSRPYYVFQTSTVSEIFETA